VYGYTQMMSSGYMTTPAIFCCGNSEYCNWLPRDIQNDGVGTELALGRRDVFSLVRSLSTGETRAGCPIGVHLVLLFLIDVVSAKRKDVLSEPPVIICSDCGHWQFLSLWCAQN
jgi:hypothetical protein